jgi:uncharacterized peroxidase-related enzyme
VIPNRVSANYLKPAKNPKRTTKGMTMSRINALNPAEATGKARQLLDGVQANLGLTPNMMRVMASSPAVLEAYLNFSGALAGGSLSPQVREQIALAVGEANLCSYCLSAHTAIGGKLGLKPDAIAQARNASASDAKANAILKLARSIVVKRGEITDEEFQGARKAGLADGEIAEVVANVAVNIFTNYFNNIVQTDIDFPKVEPGMSGVDDKG